MLIICTKINAIKKSSENVQRNETNPIPLTQVYGTICTVFIFLFHINKHKHLNINEHLFDKKFVCALIDCNQQQQN
jgi:hypothetical protein